MRPRASLTDPDLPSHLTSLTVSSVGGCLQRGDGQWGGTKVTLTCCFSEAVEDHSGRKRRRKSRDQVEEMKTILAAAEQVVLCDGSISPVSLSPRVVNVW